MGLKLTISLYWLGRGANYVWFGVFLGINYFIIPDLPFGVEYVDYNIIPVVSSMVDIDQFCKLNFKSELVYCVSGFGVTGETDIIFRDAEKFVSEFKNKTGKKVALGFGIKSRDEISQVLNFADLAVIGSQLIREYNSFGLNFKII